MLGWDFKLSKDMLIFWGMLFSKGIKKEWDGFLWMREKIDYDKVVCLGYIIEVLYKFVDF